MFELILPDRDLKIDFCKDTGGAWIDGNSLRHFFESAPAMVKAEIGTGERIVIEIGLQAILQLITDLLVF
jgi:hypothetical protein